MLLFIYVYSTVLLDTEYKRQAEESGSNLSFVLITSFKRLLCEKVLRICLHSDTLFNLSMCKSESSQDKNARHSKRNQVIIHFVH